MSTLLLALLGCGGGSDSGGSGAAQKLTPASGGGFTSTNWSGYQLAGQVGGFNRVSATWIVPSVAASSTDTASATWTGVGGGCANPPSCTATDPTLIQAGTSQDNSGGSPNYFAWWEALPSPAVPASGGPLSSQNFDVQPGDQISVSIDGNNAAVWNIVITDVRSGAQQWQFRTSVPYSAAGLTAEWIEERQLVNGMQPPLSNFGRVFFDSLTANGSSPALNLNDRIVLTDQSGKVLANPSAPASGGAAFADCFGSSPCQ